MTWKEDKSMWQPILPSRAVGGTRFGQKTLLKTKLTTLKTWLPSTFEFQVAGNLFFFSFFFVFRQTNYCRAKIVQNQNTLNTEKKWTWLWSMSELKIVQTVWQALVAPPKATWSLILKMGSCSGRLGGFYCFSDSLAVIRRGKKDP